MSLWSLTAAAVLTGLTVGAQQAAPVAQAAPPAPAVQVVAVQEDSGQRVSVDFEHAQVSEVLNWLSKNGASFVAADSELPKDATITMSVKDQPLDEVVDAIASALGGHWERRGGVRVFRAGNSGGFGEAGGWNMAPSGTMKWNASPGGAKVFTLKPGDKEGNFKVFDDGGKTFVMPEMNFQMPNMDELRAKLKDLPGMSDEQREEMEKALTQSHDEMMKSGEEMKISQKAMEEAHRAMEKAMREHPEAFNGNEMKMSQKAMQEAHRAMEKAMREHPEAFNGNEMKFPEKAMIDAEKAMEKAQKEHPEAFKDGDSFFIAPPGEKGRTFLYRTQPRMPNQPGLHFMTPRFEFRGHDFTKLFTSLSPEQKELNRRQGYLKASDLTESQREMIGVSGDGKGWTIKIVKDGEEVTIKSDR